MTEKKIRVAFFPYGTAGENPYQNLLIRGLMENDVIVDKVPGRKWFPLLRLLRNDHDIVHFFWPHDLYTGKNVFTRVIKRTMLILTLPILSRKPVLYSAENIASHGTGKSYARSEIRWIGKILNHCKGIIFMVEKAPEVFARYYKKVPEKKWIVPHVRYAGIYPNTTNKSDARRHLQIGPDVYLFLVPGRMEPYKGIEDCISAIKLLSTKSVLLLIAGKCGDGSYLQKLKMLAGDDQRILFHEEYIRNTEMQYYMHAADTVIINYKDIPINPGSIMLAKEFHKPILVPEIETLPGMNSGDMKFFTPDDIPALARSMAFALENTLPIISEHAEQHLAVNAPAQIGKHLKSIYKELLA